MISAEASMRSAIKSKKPGSQKFGYDLPDDQKHPQENPAREPRFQADGLLPVRKSATERRCPHCHSPMAHSRTRGAREDLLFMMGCDIFRCVSCGGRFLCFHRFSIPAPSHKGYVANRSDDRAFMIAWVAIFAGLLACLGLAFGILRRFHRWPF